MSHQTQDVVFKNDTGEIDKAKKVATQVEVGKESLSSLLQRKLIIPDYQRKYCWGKEQVSALLSDINDALKLGSETPLFLGTIIVHQESDGDHLVDGQQRSLTIALLVKALCHLFKSHQKQLPAISSLFDAKFSDGQAQQQLFENHQQITRYITAKNWGSTELRYIYKHMEFVVISINSIDQAFTFFDSQNSSGKRLTAFDLLKARHLRGIISAPEVGIGCSNVWEKNEKQTVGNGHRLAYYLTNQILARTRFRQRNMDVEELDLEQEFPVLTNLHSGKSSGTESGIDSAVVQLSPPTANALYRDWSIVYDKSNINNPFTFESVVSVGDQDVKCKLTDVTKLPLQINQPLMGGEQFFFYIEKYTELYRQIFPSDLDSTNEKIKPVSFPEKLLALHRQLECRQSSGYSRLIEIWLSLVIFYVDRFGSDDSFCHYVALTEQYVFSLRITEAVLRRSTVENKIRDSKVFDQLLQCPTSAQAIALIDVLCEKKEDGMRVKLNDLDTQLKKKSRVQWSYLECFYVEKPIGFELLTSHETSFKTEILKLANAIKAEGVGHDE
jgi:hypothetical protein